MEMKRAVRRDGAIDRNDESPEIDPGRLGSEALSSSPDEDDRGSRLRRPAVEIALRVCTEVSPHGWRARQPVSESHEPGVAERSQRPGFMQLGRSEVWFGP